MKNEQQENCDNCANMTLGIGRDRLMHRRCENTHRYIPDWDHNATCNNHISIAVKGGAR